MVVAKLAVKPIFTTMILVSNLTLDFLPFYLLVSDIELRKIRKRSRELPVVRYSKNLILSV